MKTYQQGGTVITLTAPTGGVVSGTAYLIGTIVVIATETVAQTLPFRGLVTGVVTVPKAVEEVWTDGMKVYFHEDANEFTLDPDTAANQLVGVAVDPVPVSVLITSTALAADLAIDGLTLQVLDYATLGSATPPPTITVKIGSAVPVVLTEGSEWTASSDDDTTAASIADAIAALVGVDAADEYDTVTVTPATGDTAASSATGRIRLDGASR